MPQAGFQTLRDFRCDDCTECGVGRVAANGLSTDYDWSKCVHPEKNPKSG